jgi:acyl carrier protein
MNESEINERFLNFSPATLDAIRRYHARKDPALVSPIVHGIVEKYLPEHLRSQAIDPAKSLNAFGLESLTLVEVFLDMQDALAISVAEDELRGLKNFNEAIELMSKKVAALRESAAS